MPLGPPRPGPTGFPSLIIGLQPEMGIHGRTPGNPVARIRRSPPLIPSPRPNKVLLPAEAPELESQEGLDLLSSLPRDRKGRDGISTASGPRAEIQGYRPTLKENEPQNTRTQIRAGSPDQEPEIAAESRLVCPSPEPGNELETIAKLRDTDSVP